MSVWVSVLWVAGRIIVSILEEVPECLEGHLCLFWRNDHTKCCASVNERDWE